MMKLYTTVRDFFEGKLYTALLLLASACFVVFGVEAYGAIVLLNVGAVALLFSENIIAAFTPALLACTFVIKCYDSATVFLPLWWTALFPILAIVAYLVIYKRKITVGKSFFGLLAVSFAVTLSGLFTVSPGEYFSGASLYYVVMLGFGMLAAYLFIRAHTVENDRYDVFDKYVDIMICVGAFASFVVFEYYAVNFQTTLMAKQLANVQWSNNISTLLMITMPFPLYRAKKSVWWLGLFATEYAAILLAASRGGWLMGSLELVICLIVSFLFMDYGKRKRILIATAGVLVILVGVVALVVMLEYLKNVNLSIKRDESRTRMFVRSFENLMTNPIFGIGISSGENADLYAGKQGTMVWYHMMIPQVVGSMGILGIVCYFKQFKDRLLMVVKNAEPYVITLGLSYMGLLLMSQVNPGEFCPLPYTLLAVVTFVLIEKRIEKRS